MINLSEIFFFFEDYGPKLWKQVGIYLRTWFLSFFLSSILRDKPETTFKPRTGGGAKIKLILSAFDEKLEKIDKNSYFVLITVISEK